MTKGNTLVDELAKEIADKFYWLWTQKYTSQTKWTEALIDTIGKVGVKEEYGYEVYAKNFKEGAKDYGEWLFDMAWIKRDGEKWEVVMAMESEWDPSETAFRDDFEKLMVARCRLRVMSFTLKDDLPKEKKLSWIEKMENKLSWIEKEVDKCKHTDVGDRYLFVGWPADNPKSQETKEMECWDCKVKEMNPVRFDKILLCNEFAMK